MSDTKFTPGPWEVFINDCGDKWTGWPISIDAANDPDKTVVRTGGFYPYEWCTATSQREAVANAALISAAPDMYAALEHVLSLGIAKGCKPDHPRISAIYRIYDVLAKARGETLKSTEGE